MGTDWEEVKKLAFDFQRAQQMSSVQKLSERNCVDIVKRLIEMKLVDVIFTNDGKEYLTGEHLQYEIEGELYSAGGRISIPDLVSILNVDYSHVEAKANHISRNSGGEVNIVLGQLVSRDYKNHLASEIDLHLQESGSLAISDLSKQYDLPADFLVNLIQERLGHLIKAKLDKDARVLYTFDYLAQFESKIVGIFSAITRPVTIQQIINRYNIAEKILTSTLDELLSKRRILGSMHGSSFIPDIYSKNQQEYVNDFFKHNRYLDYSTLNKLGITNARVFLQKKFADQLCYLDSCAVDRMLGIQIETTIEDCIQNNHFVDLTEIIPSVLSVLDIDILIRNTMERNKSLADATSVFCDTFIVSNVFLDKVKGFFDDKIKSKANDDLKNGKLQKYFLKNQKGQAKGESNTDDKKLEASTGSGKKGRKSGGGGGGNTQGREIKTKAVKKKYKTGKQTAGSKGFEPEESEHDVLELMSLEEMISVLSDELSRNSEDVPVEFIEAIAESISDDLHKSYEQYARKLFISHTVEASKNKRTFAEMQRSVNEQFNKISLFSKAIFIFHSDDLKSKLTKHLLKTIGVDIITIMIEFFTNETLNENASSEVRAKFINKIDPEFKEHFTRLNSSVNGNSVEDFLDELQQCSDKVDLMIKKLDSKKEKVILSENQQSLIIQMSECQDPILHLHISTLLLFQVIHGKMIHASGKFVPQILTFLQTDLDATLFELMKNCQDFVLKYVTAKDDSFRDDLMAKMTDLTNQYKILINEFVGKKKTPKE